METKTELLVTWPDGTTQKARSATEFLLRTAKSQWSATTHQEMKDQLSKRGVAMSGYFIHPYQPDDPFIWELDRIGLIKLEER